MNALTTWKLTSASSSARRISRSADSMCSGVRRTSPRSEVKAPWIRVLSDSNKPLSYGSLTGCRKPEVPYNRWDDEAYTKHSRGCGGPAGLRRPRPTTDRAESGHDWHRCRRRIDRSDAGQVCATDGTGSSAAERQGGLQRRVGSPLRARHEQLERAKPCAPKGCRATALYAGRPREHQVVRPREERGLYRDVHAVWADAICERAVSVPDHAERQVLHNPVRTEQLVLDRSIQERALSRSEPDVVRRVDREMGRRYARHR